MTARDFSDVVTRLSRSSSGAAPSPGTPRSVTVLGAGPIGRALAAWALAGGVESVTLFSVYSDELETLAGGSITLRGEGPVGTFRVHDQAEGGSSPAIRLTSVLDAAVAEADAVVVTGPTFKLRTYGIVLAPHLRPNQLVVVAGSRTFGSLEMEWWLEAGGSQGPRTVVELPAVPFDVRVEGSTLHLERRRRAIVGVKPAQRTSSVDWIAALLDDVDTLPTTLHSSFADASGLVEVPALLLGGAALGDGRAPRPPGAVPLAPATFRSLLAPRAIDVVDALAGERRRVAAHYGVRDLPSTAGWVEDVAGADDPATGRAVPAEAAAELLVREGVLGSLVPLSSAGRHAGEPTPVTDAIIQLTAAALGSDLGAAGRSLGGIGFAGAVPDEIRRNVGVGGRGDDGR